MNAAHLFRPDPRIKQSCPFCGEAVFLSFQDSACPWPIIENGDTLRDENGYDVENYVDGVSCLICYAFVPLIAWNREIPADELAIMRKVEIDPADLQEAQESDDRQQSVTKLEAA